MPGPYHAQHVLERRVGDRGGPPARIDLRAFLDRPELLDHVVHDADVAVERLGDELEAPVGHRGLHRQSLHTFLAQPPAQSLVQRLLLETHDPRRALCRGLGRLDVAGVRVDPRGLGRHDHRGAGHVVEHALESRQVPDVGGQRDQRGVDLLGDDAASQRRETRLRVHERSSHDLDGGAQARARTRSRRNPRSGRRTPGRSRSRGGTLPARRCSTCGPRRPGSPIAATASRSA